MNWVDCFALLEHGRCRGGDGGGSWGGCGRGCWCSASRFFVFFRPVCLGYDGSEDGDRSCGWGGRVSVVEVVCGVGMGLSFGGAGIREEGVGCVSVSGGGVRWRHCCRFPNVIFGELWEDLPYCLPFRLYIDDGFLQVGLERKMVKVIEAPTGQRVEKSVGGSKSLNGLWARSS